MRAYRDELDPPWRGSPWRPLLAGELAQRAQRVTARLAAGLDRACPAGPQQLTVSGGSAGLAVCYATLARAGGDETAAAKARACLGEAIDRLAAQPASVSLYSGFTGVAWAAELVDALLAAGAGDRNEAVDAALDAFLHRRAAGSVHYDLINGLTGAGVYALARWPRPAAAGCLAAVVAELGRRARWDDDGAYWRTGPAHLRGPQLQRFPDGGVDLGVAHGMAGVIPLLARAITLDAAADLAGSLLRGAVRWLLAHLVRTQSGQTVPGFLAEGTGPRPARSAWCYGDPGVALALLLAAREVGEESWAEAATGLALRSAARPAERSGVVDGGLCHGSAGLAHLFSRMYQLTGEPVLKSAAVSWFGHTLSLCESGLASGPAAPAADGGAQPAWNGAGLLEGAAGIVLSLLAATSGVEPAWDQLLLVATPGPAGVRA